MRTSITVTNFSWADEPLVGALRRVVEIVDATAIDTVWVADHLLQAEPGAEPTEPMLEAYTALGYLAARTERVRLGTMVSAVGLRPPALLVKAVTTLDVLSGGRAWLGVGAGYQGLETDALGLPLPPTAERFEWLEDTLQLARRMWAGDDSPFVGRRVRAEHPIGSPGPRSVPGPPILVGGTGEQKTLRLVAAHADACNLPDMPDGGETIRHKLDVLAGHCADAGRDRSEIEVTVSTRLEPGAPADDLVARAKDLAPLGVDHLVVLTRGPWTDAAVATLADAAAVIAET